jgi:hypothetical protein
VPVSGMSDLESYVTNKVINGHCDCMFMINTYGWEWTTIAALVAPRPLLFANSDNDKIFPMDGNRRIIARLRQLYQIYGKPDLVNEHVSHGGHDYRPDLRMAAFAWINKHLKNDAGPVKDADFKPLPGKELRVFPDDNDVPKDAINGKVDETFVPLAQVKMPEAGKFEEWKKDLIKELRAKSFRSFPDRIPAAKNAKIETIFNITPMPEPGIQLTTGFFAQAEKHEDKATMFVFNSDEWRRNTVEQSIRSKSVGSMLEGGYGAILAVRGVGAEWTQKSPPNNVERSAALLGSTVDQGRVWDIAATIRMLDRIDVSSQRLHWRIVGRGQAGILAAYAALFEPTIEEVIIIDPPISHREGPIFLNVLRVLDIPDALGMLAPRPLTLVNAKDPAFDRTAQIYKLAGAETKFHRK